MLTPATCWYLVFTFNLKDSMNGKQMNGNRYEIRAGIFKGHSSNRETGTMKNSGRRILIVERDTYLALTMVFALTQAGCDVVAVHTGKNGLKLARKKQFDLIAVDVELPDITGFELCSKFKKRHISQKAPILFIAANPPPKGITEAKKCGAVDYLTKPFEASEFVPRLLSHVRRTKEVYAD
jgi:DNA-binding response OmpR family regulator